MNRATTRLAAHAGTRQVRASLLADRAALAADRAVQGVWQRFLAFIDQPCHPANVWVQALEIGRLLHAQTLHAVHGSLDALARWGYRSAARNVVRTLPRSSLERVALRRRRGRLREDEGDGPRLGFGSVEDILFPPPSEDFVRGILFGSGWVDYYRQATKLATPQAVAGTIATGLIQGRTQQEIARALLPIVGGVRSTAKRLARTEGLRVASAMQMQAHEQLGDLVIGYAVHATLDQHTRPEHAHRSGTIYWKNPKPGQLGLDKMPHPPMESDGTPAWNCRCVTGKARIHADVRWIVRSLYDGEAVEIRTRGGARLTVTANHPMATPNGFVPAGQLDKGDYLFSDRVNVRESTNDVEDGVATVEDVFQSLAVKSGLLRLQRPLPLEFHGDGKFMCGEVHIVGADFGLMLDGKAALTQGENQSGFVGRAANPMRRPCLFGASAFGGPRPLHHLGSRTTANRHARVDELFDQPKGPSLVATAHVDAAACQPVAVGKGFEGLPCKVSLDEVGRTWLRLGEGGRFRFRPEVDPKLNETPPDRVPFDAVGAPDFVAGFTRKIAGRDVRRKRLFQGGCQRLKSAAKSDAVAREELANGLALHAGFLRKLRKRCAGFVSPDEIVYVRRFHLRSFVYSVDTGLGYYMGSDSRAAVIQGNCYISPVLAPPPGEEDASAYAPDPGPAPEVFTDWWKQATPDERRIAVGARRYALVSDAVGEPEWGHFVQHDTGELVPLEALRVETDVQRAERAAKVRAHVESRRKLERAGVFQAPEKQPPSVPPKRDIGSVAEEFGVPLEDNGHATIRKFFGPKKAKQIPAMYLDSTGKVHINEKSDYWKDAANAAAREHERGWWSSPDPSHVIYHEMAHALQDSAGNLSRLKNQAFSKVAIEELSGKVSRYAMLEPKEFVAEVFAGMMAGRQYDDVVMKWYRAFYGPSPTQSG